MTRISSPGGHSPQPPLRWVAFLVLGDIIFLNGSYLIAFVLRFGTDVPASNLISYVITAPWITLAMLLLNSVYGLYDLGARTWLQLRPAVISSSLMTFLLGVVISFFLRGFSFPRTVLVLAMLVHLVSFYVWRRMARRLVPRRPATALVLLALPAEEAAVCRHVAEQPGEFRLCGVIRPAGEPAQLVSACLAAGAEAILLGSGAVGAVDRNGLVQAALGAGLRVMLVPTVDDVWLASADLRQSGDLMLLEAAAIVRQGDGLKRLMDLAVAATGLLLTSPLVLAAAIAIRLDSHGPIFYRQERVGQGGRFFWLYKLRTMQADAEAATGPVLSTGPDDPRVTRVGRFLRAARLDELPQLWNVLRGDMSLVGPRPERPTFVEQYSREDPAYALRHRAKVGLTGLAQVAGRYSTTAPDKLRYDLYYVNARSLWLDLTILLRTVQTVLTRSKSA
ncbi:MAG: sugar transferase [Symbiobacteriia bacterium]